MDKHSFTFEQYCKVLNKNIILEEITYHNGARKLRCLNLYNCEALYGGCKNKYVLNRIKKTAEKSAEKAIEKTTAK